jgi:cytoskeleton protein RodZ
MAMITGRSGLPAGESPLDARACADIGVELARVRVARGLSLDQVGEQLLLSTRQVKALEEVDFTAFHNPTFHLKALRKYVVFAGVDTTLLNRVAAAVARPEPVLTAATADEPLVDEGARRGLVVVGSILLVAAAVAAGGYFLWLRDRPAPPATSTTAQAEPLPPPPPVPVAQPAVVTAAEVAPAEATAPTGPAGNAPPVGLTPTVFGSVRVLHPTWIFLRDADNNATEKTLAAGETLEFDTQPTYLAVGSSDVELTIAARPVDIARFVQNGQIRIRAGDFDALVQGASPIPAPTAAAVR